MGAIIGSPPVRTTCDAPKPETRTKSPATTCFSLPDSTMCMEYHTMCNGGCNRMSGQNERNADKGALALNRIEDFRDFHFPVMREGSRAPASAKPFCRNRQNCKHRTVHRQDPDRNSYGSAKIRLNSTALRTMSALVMETSGIRIVMRFLPSTPAFVARLAIFSNAWIYSGRQSGYPENNQSRSRRYR